MSPPEAGGGSIDYWAIRKTDIISEIGEETIFTNPIYYNDPKIVVRDADGFVNYIQVKKENRGKLNTSGFDLALNWRGETSSIGRLRCERLRHLDHRIQIPDRPALTAGGRPEQVPR